MAKYIDLIGYPIAFACVYVLIGMLTWDKDPANWEQGARCLWLCWGLVWGWALQIRIQRGGEPWMMK